MQYYRFPVSKPSVTLSERSYVDAALRDCRLTQGENVAAFERKLAKFLDVPHVVACTSGTTALHLALAALHIGPGDEVIVPDLTYVATANAVRYTGATVVLADVDEFSGCLSVNDMSFRMTSRTKAVMPVHLYGVACEMMAIVRRTAMLAQGVSIVEDAAEGFGGFYNSYALGTIGACGTFSFYGNKILTTGEGGAVTTSSSHLAERLRHLRGMAQTERYFHDEIGFNYRMTDIQAAIGLGQMDRIDGMLQQRRDICELYASRLWATPFTKEMAPWLFTFQLPRHVDRAYMMYQLATKGIETRPTFVPLHRMPMFAGEDADYPNACQFGDRGLCLPTYPDLKLSEVEEICDEVERQIK